MSVLRTPYLGKANQVVVVLGLVLSTSCLVMRIYTKTAVMKRFWWDDVFIILAWTFAAAIQATLLYGFSHAGVGIHMTELSPSTLVALQKTVITASIVYLPCLAFAKLALLMLYYRLLYTVKAWVYTLSLVGFVVVGYTIALTVVLIFPCHPIEKNWNPLILEGSCINRNGAYLATAATNTISDIILLLIPVRVVSKLQMPLMEKLGAFLMFGIGSLTIIMSIVRLATLWPLINSQDFSYHLALVCTFVNRETAINGNGPYRPHQVDSNIEANLIILCACLPFLRQLIRHFAPQWTPWGGHSRNTRSSSSNSTPGRILRGGPRADAVVVDLEISSISQETVQDGFWHTEGS
ncbi:uncharacterized protein BP01DRAFT_332721 [Aspergillus saccharolyticus JOP 1030-1]|uniref:Rhodopsin domain-containing protein n=1 Tax=Aspergillus saccharolyticus JOP 1030-1 TaxID=1450539 RepID=A0A318ZWR3_9EURO|nr:hypothetical protein BP01DRAFT_332721 [Aspergillus saccharolyticus JOP 1030-1]PYH48753.1 hypothetical protein BP01DRAFT_332721 [Aspergillus saccharolyticus JOP 1030-1]